VFPPLADYALLGDCETAFLVARDGSLDWACLPRFDSPAAFAALLDRDRGGCFRIAPGGGRAASTHRYLPGTAVVETLHEDGVGVLRVLDAAVPGGSVLVRSCEALAGEVELEVAFHPTSGYGREPATVESAAGLLVAQANGLELRLASTTELSEADTTLTLRAGDRTAFVLGWGDELPRPGDAEALVEQVAAWWRRWLEGVVYDGPYREAVERSSITLKLLSHAETGGIVAAPTTSLPEKVGGDSNWDYRYTWLRDAALAVYGWYATGQRAQGDPLFDWICARVEATDILEDGLRIMYDLDGRRDLDEQVLEHLAGYRDSRPVRVGNAACLQEQLDIYGSVLDCFTTAATWGREEKLELWETNRPLAEWICAHWTDDDHGPWELRGRPASYVYSDVMAWTALDRAARVAHEKGLEANVERWHATMDAIRSRVFELGWNERLGAFCQSFENDRVDAANLLVPLVGFLRPDDPRGLSNLDRIRTELAVDGLVYRFRPRGDEPEEGAFTVCTFWLVDALVLAGRVEEATTVFERMLARATPLGLFAEEIEPGTGEHLGNFPQAFTHAALLTAAVNLARATDPSLAPASLEAPPNTAHLVPAA
jgi:GH15 family glucan-1,4-alpha-glucosidase